MDAPGEPPVPPLPQLIADYERMAGYVRPAPVVAVSLKTNRMDEDATPAPPSRRPSARPAFPPTTRCGSAPGKLLDAVLAARAQLTSASWLTTCSAALAALVCRYSLEVEKGHVVLVESPAVAQPFLVALVAELTDLGAHTCCSRAGVGRDGHPERGVAGAAGAGDRSGRARRRDARPRDLDLVRVQHPAPERGSGRQPGDRAGRPAGALRPLLRARGGRRAALVRHHAARATPRPRRRGWPGRLPAVRLRRLQARRARPGRRMAGAGRPPGGGRRPAGAVSSLRIVAEGTDLTVDVSGRPWISADGRENMPDGEVYTSPHELATRATSRSPSTPRSTAGW